MRIVLVDVVATESGVTSFAEAGVAESVELLLVKVDMGKVLKDEGGRMKVEDKRHNW